jgi:hypothetical protein
MFCLTAAGRLAVNMVRPTLSLAVGLLLLLFTPPGQAAPLKYVNDYWLRGRASW